MGLIQVALADPPPPPHTQIFRLHVGSIHTIIIVPAVETDDTFGNNYLQVHFFCEFGSTLVF